MAASMVTIRDLIQKGVQQLAQAEPQVARIETYMLLEYVLDANRTTLYAYPEREVTEGQVQYFLSLVERRMQGEPVAYLLGYQEFYGRDFIVDRRVLIPRPETELLVESALIDIRERLRTGHIPVVADIGTGSGIIPITLALEEPRLPLIYGTDISSDALVVAAINCQKHTVELRVRLLQGDLLEPLPEHIDLLTANLPYVGTEEIPLLTKDVIDYEPHLALFSGTKGLTLLQQLFMQIEHSPKIGRGSVLILEIGYAQREPLTQWLTQYWPDALVSFKKDYAGWDRLLHVTL